MLEPQPNPTQPLDPPPPLKKGAADLAADEGDDGNTSLSSVFTLCNSAVGAGVLALPYAFRHAGLVSSLVLAMLVAALEGATLYVLSKFAEVCACVPLNPKAGSHLISLPPMHATMQYARYTNNNNNNWCCYYSFVLCHQRQNRVDNNKRPLTPKSMPPAGDEHAKLKT